MFVIAGWIAAAVIAIGTLTGGLPNSPPSAVAASAALTVAALVLWLVSLSASVTDTRVLAIALVITGLSGAALDLLHPAGPGYILALMAVAGIGLRLPRRTALIAGCTVVLAAGFAEAVTSEQPLSGALNVAIGAGFLFVASTFAAANRDAHAQAAALLRQEEATRAAREEAVVLAERTRLAREMHDVLAHTLSGLAVQLEGARLLAEHTNADARLIEQMSNAQRLARDGMLNARRAVEALRGQELPGTDQLPELITETRRGAGIPVSFTETGTSRTLRGESGLAIYRAVQEALTNTAKHAGRGARADVVLSWQAHTVVVEVRDTGGDALQAGHPSGSFGLAGLAERAALVGGLLESGATDDGWFVRLTLPIENLPTENLPTRHNQGAAADQETNRQQEAHR